MQACKGTETVSLKKILKNVCKKSRLLFGNDVRAKSGTVDPDEVRPGDVYFALSEDDDVLEESVGLAIHHGCSAVVADRPVVGIDSLPFFILSNPAEGFAAFCHAVHDYPGKSLKLIGITGTSGKTTTSYLISGMLAEAGFQVGLIGSLGIFDGQEFHVHSKPDQIPPDQLVIWLDRMAVNGCTHVIIETSSQMIANGWLGGIQFDAVCLTNIRRDHLDFHKTVEHYRRSKLAIFKYAKKKALAICNIDDRISEAIVPLIDQPLLSIGIRNQAEVGSLLVERSSEEQTFIITAGTEAVSVQTKIIGDEFIYNCMMATALGIGFEIDIKTIVRGIERVENIPGRMERIECGQNFNVYIDSARTVDSLAAVLRTVRNVTAGKLICVFGAADYHDPEKRLLFGKTMETLADSIILTAAVDRLNFETATAICDIGKGFALRSGVRIMPERAEAIAWALSAAAEGDSVVIFGRGESEHSEQSDTVPFCDRNFAKQWLYENQVCFV
ncbi:MAG: UDP-N-acetylmuramyl-tripeptide synthetase [Planctomycetaceae bacterium]|jgi:UDP-N-acetylmuramoyl-L-alanyl-D-glutamate--2,6-diaminopimelate ligase|nr:UDP-N-acetylmuramyl-tripeptide synthetase [Planctomycetaceae bacterium]